MTSRSSPVASLTAEALRSVLPAKRGAPASDRDLMGGDPTVVDPAFWGRRKDEGVTSINWSELGEEDIGLVRSALVAAHDGPFFEDWEFRTLMGVSRAEMGEVIHAMASSPGQWPSPSPEFFETAAKNALANLSGYPLGTREIEILATRWNVDLDRIGDFFDRWTPERR